MSASCEHRPPLRPSKLAPPKALTQAFHDLLMSLHCMPVHSRHTDPALDAARRLFDEAVALVPQPPPCPHDVQHIVKSGLATGPMTVTVYCHDCGERLEDRADAKRPVRQDDTTWFVCDACHRRFPDQWRAENHPCPAEVAP